jgi:hypothetical protein
LLGYDYEIEYIRGKKNVVTDTLSRTASQKLYSIVVSSVSSNIIKEITRFWQEDPYLLNVMQDLQTTPRSHPLYT